MKGLGNVRCFQILAIPVAVCVLTCGVAYAQVVDPVSIGGIVVDDVKAETVGEWTSSVSTKPYIGAGYIHDANAGKGEKSVTFTLTVPADGEYEVLFGYTAGGNRDKKVPVTIEAADGSHTKFVDETIRPSLADGFEPLGRFRFVKSKPARIVISNAGTSQHVIIDAVALMTTKQLSLAKAKKRPTVTKRVKNRKPVARKKTEPRPKAAAFKRVASTRKVQRLSSTQLDMLLAQSIGAVTDGDLTNDEAFLRRATLDALGRQPTPQELTDFLDNKSADKRMRVINRLLASPEFGRNWADYLSDTIGYRQQEPQLTFHDYRPFKRWLAESINSGKGWDEITYAMLTAHGKVIDDPAGTFIAFHQAEPKRLAGETSRVFLGIQIHCAECHDHPFVDMPQETFHGMAAFFARTSAKIPHNKSGQIDISSKNSGEHKMPGKKGTMQPTVLDGTAQELGQADLDRRAILANWIVAGDNAWFARNFVNRAWSRLLGRGFFEPVDDLGEGAEPVFPEIHASLADHFVASEFNVQDLFRLVMNTRAYQQNAGSDSVDDRPFAQAVSRKLRGDEVFASLVTAVELPNVRGKQAKATSAIRFPPPPKSTRDLVNAAFGFDPSLKDRDVTRTMKQAMFLMNNVQLQKQIDSTPESGTVLAKLLVEVNDDEQAVRRLYLVVLGRRATEREVAIVMKHRQKVGDRGKAFEDVLWSLINSAEFTTRR